MSEQEHENVRSLVSAPDVDKPRIERAMREVLDAIGEDTSRDGLLKTPARVAKMYDELFWGLHRDPDELLEVVFEADHDEMIMVRDIPLYSMCEHHLLPFIGQAHVAYIPNERGCITGLSKLARVVDLLAHRPQVQERLTTQIADCIEKVLQPRGVFVVLEAEHLCMTMRGVSKPGSRTITSAVRGIFRDNEPTRAEAMGLIRS
ncbi:MAG: cyclohydrolase [Actinomycetota bacterium]|jgi:GTP cyclohydrolase I|nr:cyclohydrolase [Actinomycetota bacterium]